MSHRKVQPRYLRCAEIEHLRRSGWTVSRIAYVVGVTSRAVYRWSVGDARPRSGHLRILQALAE
jgi:DNA-binding transcriptional regulator YiaG